LGRKMDDDACGGNIEKVTGNHCSSLFLWGNFSKTVAESTRAESYSLQFCAEPRATGGLGTMSRGSTRADRTIWWSFLGALGLATKKRIWSFNSLNPRSSTS
jgi:hypothetical protein